MSNIFITPQQKEEWEAKIAELESDIEELSQRTQVDYKEARDKVLIQHKKELQLFNDLLQIAIVLPVERNWIELDENDIQELEFNYPNGVIIKPQ